MKHVIAALIVCGVPAAASADVSKDEVLKLLKAGVSEASIVNYIAANGPALKLSSDDLVELKDAGASEAILKAMISASYVGVDLRPPVRVVSETPSARDFSPMPVAPDPLFVTPQPRIVVTYQAWAGAARPFYAEDYAYGSTWRRGCDPAPVRARYSTDGCSGRSYRAKACWRQ